MTYRPRTSDLNRRITIQTRSSVKDTFGQQSTTWTDYITSVPAAIESLTGNELLSAQALNASATHRLVVRYHSLLADPIKVASMRAVYVNGGVTRYFNLSAGVNLDEKNRWIEIPATEGLNLG